MHKRGLSCRIMRYICIGTLGEPILKSDKQRICDELEPQTLTGILRLG
jgi:hypothetical protein